MSRSSYYSRKKTKKRLSESAYDELVEKINSIICENCGEMFDPKYSDYDYWFDGEDFCNRCIEKKYECESCGGEKENPRESHCNDCDREAGRIMDENNSHESSMYYSRVL